MYVSSYCIPVDFYIFEKRWKFSLQENLSEVVFWKQSICVVFNRDQCTNRVWKGQSKMWYAGWVAMKWHLQVGTVFGLSYASRAACRLLRTRCMGFRPTVLRSWLPACIKWSVLDEGVSSGWFWWNKKRTEVETKKIELLKHFIDDNHEANYHWRGHSQFISMTKDRRCSKNMTALDFSSPSTTIHGWREITLLTRHLQCVAGVCGIKVNTGSA